MFTAPREKVFAAWTEREFHLREGGSYLLELPLPGRKFSTGFGNAFGVNRRCGPDEPQDRWQVHSVAPRGRWAEPAHRTEKIDRADVARAH